MNNNGVVLLAIPYEMLPHVARALEEASSDYPLRTPHECWLQQRAQELRTEHHIWQEHREALASLLKSEGKS